MGLFGMSGYSRPGRGVSKDEPQKKGAARFFELFFRKFWSYIKLNMLYLVTCIPTFIYYVTLISWLTGDLLMGADMPVDDAAMSVMIVSSVFAMAVIMFCAGSPCMAGYTYILRNYVREEHAWLWSDFFEHTRKNFKQAVAAYFIDIAVMTVFFINLRFYLLMSMRGLVYMALGCIFAVIVVFYIIMHSYLWTMMVTFRLELKQIYKNAFIFSVLALPRNLGGILVRGAVFGILFFSFINFPIAMLLCVLVMVSVMGLITQMFSYPVIKKYMLDKIETSVEDSIEEDEDFYGDNDDYIDDDIDDVDYPEILNENDVASLFKNKDGKEEQ